MNLVAMVGNSSTSHSLVCYTLDVFIIGWISYIKILIESNKIGSLTCCNLQMMIIKGLDETHIINTQR